MGHSTETRASIDITRASGMFIMENVNVTFLTGVVLGQQAVSSYLCHHHKLCLISCQLSYMYIFTI